MYDVVMYMLWLVAAIGMFSYSWGRICTIMFICSTTYILLHHFLLTPWPFDLKYMGYASALVTCLFGIALTKYYAIPVDLDYDEKQKLLETIKNIAILYLITFILAVSNQYVFNVGLPKENIIHSIYQPAVFTITALQIILLLKGGSDGLNKIESYIGSFWAASYSHISNMEIKQNFKRKREET